MKKKIFQIFSSPFLFDINNDPENLQIDLIELQYNKFIVHINNQFLQYIHTCNSIYNIGPV